MAIGDQTGQDVDEAIERTAMPGVLNLRNILELIDDTFDDGTLA